MAINKYFLELKWIIAFSLFDKTTWPPCRMWKEEVKVVFWILWLKRQLGIDWSRLPNFWFRLHHCPSVWSRENCFTFLSLSFLICKMKVITETTSKDCLFIQWHLLNTCSVTDTLLDGGDTMHKKKKNLPLEANILLGLQDIMYIKCLVESLLPNKYSTNVSCYYRYY